MKKKFFDFCKTAFPIDLFTGHRFIYNVVLYTLYTTLFVFSLLVSNGIVSRFNLAYSGSVIRVLNAIPFIIAFKFLVFNFFSFKRISIRLATYYDIYKLAVLTMLTNIMLIVLCPYMFVMSELPPSLFVVDALITFGSIATVYSLFKLSHLMGNRADREGKEIRTLIIGAGETGELIYISTERSVSNDIIWFRG